MKFIEIAEGVSVAIDKITAIVDDLRNAACREDTDPTLPHQRGLGIRDGPSNEECMRRLVRRLDELEAIRDGALG